MAARGMQFSMWMAIAPLTASNIFKRARAYSKLARILSLSTMKRKWQIQGIILGYGNPLNITCCIPQDEIRSHYTQSSCFRQQV